jgi:hypothetical protein
MERNRICGSRPDSTYAFKHPSRGNPHCHLPFETPLLTDKRCGHRATCLLSRLPPFSLGVPIQSRQLQKSRCSGRIPGLVSHSRGHSDFSECGKISVGSHLSEIDQSSTDMLGYVGLLCGGTSRHMSAVGVRNFVTCSAVDQQRGLIVQAEGQFRQLRTGIGTSIRNRLNLQCTYKSTEARGRPQISAGQVCNSTRGINAKLRRIPTPWEGVKTKYKLQKPY